MLPKQYIVMRQHDAGTAGLRLVNRMLREGSVVLHGKLVSQSSLLTRKEWADGR